MGILFLGFTLKFRKLGSVNALVQQIIGFFSGYSTDVKRYPQIIQFVSYVIPLTYTISLARNNTFTIHPLWLLIPAILSFAFALFGFAIVQDDISTLRKKGDTEQW